MIRSVLYLVGACAMWVIEGFVFSRFLDFSVWQTALMVTVYVIFFGVAAWALLSRLRAYPGDVASLPLWRYASLAPMLAMVLGSFASLPVLLAISVLGKVL
ncbi:MAG: hypothetical protein NVS2B16_14870 [Chloroflexota bacterium]